MLKKVMTLTILLGLLSPLFASPASAATGCKIPRGGDADNNGISDEGVVVVCNWTSYYAYDALGGFYEDLGDGRIRTSDGVNSPMDLDQATLTECFYQNHSRGTFENDPFMDSGVISNMIRCSGYDGPSTYHYQMVSEDDPRYTNNPDWAIWGTWEFHVLTVSGEGNLVAKPTN